MFLQAFIAFIFGSIVTNVAKWQTNKLVVWYLTRHFRQSQNQSRVIEPSALEQGIPRFTSVQSVDWNMWSLSRE